MDRMLIDVILWNRDIIKYVSFHEVDLQTKLRALYANNIHNIDAKYEVLEEVWVYNVIYFNNKKYWL